MDQAASTVGSGRPKGLRLGHFCPPWVHFWPLESPSRPVSASQGTFCRPRRIRRNPEKPRKTMKKRDISFLFRCLPGQHFFLQPRAAGVAQRSSRDSGCLTPQIPIYWIVAKSGLLVAKFSREIQPIGAGQWGSFYRTRMALTQMEGFRPNDWLTKVFKK